jgi:hypothetical protein
MSNKKNFWIVFIILSCCEFGQFAYSKHTSTNVKATKPSRIDLDCNEYKVLKSELVFNGISSSYLLPR